MCDNTNNILNHGVSSSCPLNGQETMALWQINCQKSGVATSDINSEVENYFKTNKKNNNLCICIQEPKFYKRMVNLSPHLDQFFVSVPGVMTRAVIAAPKACDLMLVESLSTPDLCVCQRKTKGEKNLLLISMYLDIKKPIISDALINVINYRSRIDADMVINTDSNAHSQLWGSQDNNQRGTELERFLYQNGLTVMNRGEIPTFSSAVGSSVIDLTICNDRFVDRVTDWQVVPGVIQSDHRLVTCNVIYRGNNKNKRTFRYDKANWPKFAACMEKLDAKVKLPKTWNVTRLNSEYKKINKDIIFSMKKSIPYLSVGNGTYEPKFWNENLAKLRKELRDQFKLLLVDKSNEAKGKYNEMKFQYKKAVKKAKIAFKKESISKISSIKDMSTFVKLTQKRENRTLGMLNKPDGTNCTTIEETLEHLMETHFPGSKKVDSDWKIMHENGIQIERAKNLESYSQEVVTVEKVRLAFSKFGDNKAAGLDEIKPIVLKNLPASTLKRITLIYQASLSLGHMPSDWLISKTIFIPKPGKENYKLAKSFRPISLSSFLLKGLERVVGWYLEETVLKEKPLSKWQHGFRKDKSTETAITQVINYIESAKCRGEYCVAVLLDIQGAFDNLKAAKAKEAMIKHGLPEWFVKWYGTFLTKRYATTELKGEIVVSELDRGTPQGDVISTLAWNISYDPMLCDINTKTNCNDIGFADDSIVLMRGKFLKDILAELQKAINIAEKWGEENGLTFNASKTEVLIFTDRRIIGNPKKLKMNGIPLQYSKEAKYLGVTLDTRLLWNKHIDNKINMAKRKLMTIKSVINTYCGPSNKLLEWAYRGIVIPSITYAAIAWYKKVDSAGVIQKLRQLNRLAMLLLTKGVYNSTPTRAMEILLDYPPLHLIIRKEALKGGTRMINTHTYWDGIGTGKKRGTLWTVAKDLGSIWDQSMHMETSSRCINYNQKFYSPEGNEVFDTTAVIFSRKRKNCWQGYWAITQDNKIVNDESIAYSLSHKEYQVQLFTLQNLIKEVNVREGTNRILILLDKGVTQMIKKNETRYCILQRTWDIIKKTGIEFYIRHNKENYLINHLRSRRENRKVEGPSQWISPSQINHNLQRELNELWSIEWKAYKEANQSKFWLKGLRISRNLKQKSREKIGIIIQTITGHGPFRYHLQKTAEEEIDSTCPLCLKHEETSRHLILECNAIKEERARYGVDNPNLSGNIDDELDSMLDLILNVSVLRDLYQVSQPE